MKKAIIQSVLGIACVYPHVIFAVIAVLIALYGDMILGFITLVICFIALILHLVSATQEKGQYKRLSPFFIEIKIPFLQCSIIAQRIRKKHFKGKDCGTIINELLNDEIIYKTIQQLRSSWQYVTLTHKTVIDIVYASERVYAYQKIMSSGKDRLKRVQK